MNWIPQVAGERLQFISSCDPTRVLDEQARTIAETTPAIAAGHFGGSSQTIMFDGGWLALIHEALEKPPTTRQCRQHRFVWFDESNRLRNISRPFFFHQKGAEFASGLSWHPDRTRLLVSYGVGDGESWIATVDAEEVRGTLENLNRPPFGAPDQTREHAEEPKATAKFPSSNEAAAVTGAHDSKASVPTGSTWTPKVRAAGTELMVAGLKERMGPELDQINLQINHPGHDDGDTRPRVVWMHHDINQQWVQWCKDKALVDLVRCFVFVSHWQRERYLNAFGLPPQRCCVLRHAVDLHPNLRTWDTAPVWRCAYTSTPFRGLAVLLDAWGRLRPLNAELHIWSSMKLYLGDDGPYNHLYERARAMPKVVYHGIEPNLELRAALRNMHFLVYPNIFQETACLAVIEAMAAGCRVIVPSLGALPETTGGYARVYP